MIEEYHSYILEDCVEDIIDYRGKSPTKVGSGVPLITAKIIKNGKLLPYNEYISETDYPSWMRRGIPQVGDVILTTEAPLGEVAQITDSHVALAQRVILIRGKPDVLDNTYLKYMFMSNDLQGQLKSRESGTTVIGIKQKELRKLILRLPPLPVQKKIAAILSSLDDKIEINTRMNKVLEETARALFHRWFVEFEFPNDEGKPYKSSGGRMIASEMGEIPEGWSVVELREIVDVHSGYSYKGSELHESQTALATIKNFDRNGGFKLNGFKEIVPSKKVKSEQYVRLHDIIVAHTDLTQNADVIGNCELLVSTAKYDNIIISMDLVKVVPKKTEINNYFVMSILSNVKFKQHSLGYINGTTVLHLSKSAIPDYKIPLPENMLICMVFGTILENIYTLITKNINENQVILEIRDSLIPKLMNGKVKVI